jgi:two-component system chemotaxis response regulator CheY
MAHSNPHLQSTASEPARRRVLVVDDGIIMRLFYRSVLEATGFEVEEATNGLEGFEKVLAGPFDLILVDVNMPKMDGYSMLRMVRGQAAVRMVPAVMISTEASEHDADLAFEAGANFYMVKPVASAELAEVARLIAGVVAP